MKEEWWERSTCYLCDYWWAILSALALVLAAYFTRTYWLPLIGLANTPSIASVAPNSTSISSPLASSTPGQWLHFQGTGYSLDYPEDWFASHSPTEMRDPSGIVYDLILSSAQGNQSPQEGTPDEKARITVWYIPRPTESTPAWIMQRWAWLGTMLETEQLNGTDVWTASPASEGLSQQFYWIQTADKLYTVESHAQVSDVQIRAIVRKIISTLKFE